MIIDPQKLKICGYDPWRDAEGFYFCEEEALRWTGGVGDNPGFIEHYCAHVKGELQGKALVLDEWEQVLVWNLFGWLDKEDGLRRYRTCFLYIPRKNGKTILCTAIGAGLLLIDGQLGAEIYSAAGKKEQAAIMHRNLSTMIDYNEELDGLLKVNHSQKIIQHRDDPQTVFRSLSSDAPKEHGGDAHGVLIDELHAHENRELHDALVTSTIGRRQSVILLMTTADFNRKSLCNSRLDYARRVRDGLVRDESFLPIIYETLPTEDWKDEKVHRKANPGYGMSLPIKTFKRIFRDALEDPDFEGSFKRLHLNMVTDQIMQWIPMDDWKSCTGKFDESDLEGRLCYGGLDVASHIDLAAYVSFFPELCAVKCDFFLPEETINKNSDYKIWARDGYITATEGDTIDQTAIRESIREANLRYNLIDVGFDPYDCTLLASLLKDEDRIRMIEMGQSFKNFNEPLHRLMKLVKGHELRHNNHPVLTWMAGNAAKKENATGQIMLTKSKSPGKIDGMVALAIALGRSMFSKKQNRERLCELV